MSMSARLYLVLVLGILLAAGCSSLPGLRVLSGEESADAVTGRLIEQTDLVMADKSGLTDPALMAAADRIEAASGNVDIIEIRKDLNSDSFTVYMLIRPPDQNTTQAQQVNDLRRAIELTWQGTISQSLGSDMLKVIILDPGLVPTLDKGPSYVGVVALTSEIARGDAIAYLNQRPNTVNEFVDLIAEGKMTIVQPEQGQMEFYQGQPNHPVFMLAALAAQASNGS